MSQQRVSICIVVGPLIKNDGRAAALLSITCLITPLMMKAGGRETSLSLKALFPLVWNGGVGKRDRQFFSEII